MNETKGRDWYPVIFAELERTGATEAGIGVREVLDMQEPGIWIEFIADGGGGVTMACNIEDAPFFLDSISAGEGSDLSDFGRCFDDYFGDDDDDDDDGGDEEE